MKKHPEAIKPVTAAELLNKLNQDPQFIRLRGEQDKNLKALEERFAQAEKPLVKALNDAGVSVGSVWDLVNTGKSYSQAIPILVAHLTNPFPFRIREGIARALTVANAGEAVYRVLVHEFQKLSNLPEADQYAFKWALGNAISIVATKDHFLDIVELIRDRRHGKARDMMTLRLPELDPERAIEVLIESLADDGISAYATVALSKLRSQKTRMHIERIMAQHPQPWVREEARKALKKLIE